MDLRVLASSAALLGGFAVGGGAIWAMADDAVPTLMDPLTAKDCPSGLINVGTVDYDPVEKTPGRDLADIERHWREQVNEQAQDPRGLSVRRVPVNNDEVVLRFDDAGGSPRGEVLLVPVDGGFRPELIRTCAP